MACANGATDAGSAISSDVLVTISIGTRIVDGPTVVPQIGKVPSQNLLERYSHSTISLTSRPGNGTSSRAQPSTLACISVATGSARLMTASANLAQMKVLGDASALTWDRREPGTTSVSNDPGGTRDTSASRKPLTEV